MFVLSFYEASRKSAPARAGFYEGDRMPGTEVHLKQRGIDKTGWGFFGFRGGAVPEPEEAPPGLIDAPLLQVHLGPRHPVAFIESRARRRGLARRLVEREHEHRALRERARPDELAIGPGLH